MLYLYRLIEDNFQCISIYVNERRRVSENILEELFDHLSQYLEMKYPDMQINCKLFAFNILSFLLVLILYKNVGYGFDDHEKAVKDFIDYNTSFLT